jgi:dTDP-4-dehydrorhamnose reductase
MRILILGGNGMIGHKVYQVLSDVHQDTWVLLRQSLGNIKNSELFNSQKVISEHDLTDLAKLGDTLDNLNPDVIINAVGITIRRGVENSISRSVVVNSALPHFIEEWVDKNDGKRVIHFSTDCVFSGGSGSYTEESVPDANDVYGKTKALGEISGPKSLTLRGSMIGREIENKTELLEWFLKNKSNVVKGFSEVIYSGITTLQMALFVKQIIAQFPNLSGLYNVASLPISKYDLLNLFNEHFKNGSTIIDEKGYKSRKDLIANKFYSKTGFKVPEWKDLVIDLQRDSEKYSKYYN